MKFAISALNREITPSPRSYSDNVEVQRIRNQLKSFVFDDKGEPSLLRQQLSDYKELRKQLQNAMKSADLSRKISEASTENKRKSPLISPKTENQQKSPIISPKVIPEPEKVESLLMIRPSSQLSQSAPRINIESPEQLASATVENSINSRTNKNSPRAIDNDEAWESQRQAKVRDIRAILQLLKYDKDFYKLSTDCATALDECEKVLQVQNFNFSILRNFQVTFSEYQIFRNNCDLYTLNTIFKISIPPY